MLRSISKGDFFHPQHVRDLRLPGGTLIVMSFLPGLLSLLCGWIFRASIPEELYIPVWEVFWNGKNVLASGLAVLLLARAFRMGSELERDQRSIV